jgi:hypothetical protein
VGGGKTSDAKTMGRWGIALRPEVLAALSHLSEKRIGTVRSIRGWVMLAGNGGSG